MKFTDDVFTRFSEQGALLMIMTRWHVDDPAGRLIEHFGDRVTIARYPAIAEEDEKYRRAGEPLFPESIRSCQCAASVRIGEKRGRVNSPTIVPDLLMDFDGHPVMVYTVQRPQSIERQRADLCRPTERVSALHNDTKA